MLLGQLINGLMTGGLYALVAIGFTLIVGVLHRINFAHTEVFMIGGFIGLVVASAVPSLPLALAAAFVLGGLLGVLVERISFRRLDSQEAGITAALSSMAVGLLILDLVHHKWGTEPIAFPLVDALGGGSFEIAGVRFVPVQGLVIVLTVVLVVALHLLLGKTRAGRNIRAVSDDATASALLGIPVRWVGQQVFFISSALAALTGLLFALRIGTVNSDIGLSFGLKALAITAIGGMGNVWGAVVGGLLIGLLEALAVQFGLGALSDLVVWTFMIAVLLVRPQGLFGSVFHGTGARA
ncbi:MAG: branched-chain amino acid ABC transporter permease [Variovorax sp.]